MYELIILSLLMRQPAHGYLIAKSINDIIGPYAKISNGRLYPLLTKLKKEGLIISNNEVDKTQKGKRQLHCYKITEEGRKRFLQLMMDTTSNQGDYQKFFWQKVAGLSFLHLTERLYLLDHYVNYCQTHVLHLQTEIADFVRARPQWRESPELAATASIMEHAINLWQLELNWARKLHEECCRHT